MIHIEGMGWLGSALAYSLHARGVRFTWSDTDVEHTAYRACTGIVYPAGDSRSTANLVRWAEWIRQRRLPRATVMEATYAYAHKRPPHGGIYTPRVDLGWLRVANAPCVAVDAWAVVRGARVLFKDWRTEGPRKRDRLVRAHGHTERREGWVWGWSRPVRLTFPPEVTEAVLEPDRLALYGKVHRFALTYAYPIPTTPWLWWAGSSLVNERTPRVRSAGERDDTWLRWLRDFTALFPGVIPLTKGEMTQGWRPRPAPDDLGELTEDEHSLTFPPLWHSGVRWAPLLVDEAVERLCG